MGDGNIPISEIKQAIWNIASRSYEDRRGKWIVDWSDVNAELEASIKRHEPLKPNVPAEADFQHLAENGIRSWKEVMALTEEQWTATVQLSFACGLFALWLTYEGRGLSWLPTARRSEVAFHNRTLWIHPWSKPNDWHRADLWWVQGVSLNFEDLLLGRAKCSTRVLDTHEVLIPMPEGCYPATVTIKEHTWKRPRWFAKKRIDSSVDIPGGIPHEGHGILELRRGRSVRLRPRGRFSREGYREYGDDGA